MFYYNYVDQCNHKGLSPSAAAEQMGFKKSVVTRWKHGTKPRQATLQKIASFFGCDVEDLTKEKPATQSDGSELVNKDEELTELLQRARDDPRIRMLFSVAKNATPEDVERAIKIIQMLKGE